MIEEIIDAADIVIESLRVLACYRQLEREYGGLSSDEAGDETIIANEYTFTKAGRRFGPSRPEPHRSVGAPFLLPVSSAQPN